MARMDVEDLSPHQQMILIGQPVNMVNTNRMFSMTPVWTYIPSIATIHWAVIIHSLPATVCPVPPPSPPGGQQQVRNQYFPGFKFCVSRFHTPWSRRSPRRAVRWTMRRTSWSVSRSRWQAHNWISVMESSSRLISLFRCASISCTDHRNSLTDSLTYRSWRLAISHV